jgi:hypothetical protein
MKLASPRQTLAGCIWLPRILAKARLLKSGHLPADYEARFCHPTGVDGLFLSHFGISREEIVAAAEWPDERVGAWFLTRSSPERIVQWNVMALNFGRPGFPMAERFPTALATTYKHLAGRGFTTVFEVLEADDQLAA